MAGPIGGPGGFATVEGPQRNYIGEAMGNTENMAFRYREEKRYNNEIAEQKRRENLVKDDFTPDVSVTANSKFNDMAIPYFMGMKKRFSDNIAMINATKDPFERQKLMQSNERIKQNVGVMEEGSKSLKAMQTDLIDGVKNGKYSDRDAKRVATLLDAADAGKGKLYIDDYGQARMSLYATDEKGQPTGEIASDKTLGEIIAMATPHKVSTYDDDLREETKAYKINKVTSEKNGEEISKQVKGQRELDNANAFAERVLNEPHNLFELSQRTGIPETEKDKLKEVVAKEFLGKLNEEQTQKHDYGYDANKIAQSRLALAKKADNRAERKLNKEESDNVKVVVSDGNQLTKYDQSTANKGGVIPKGSRSISFINNEYKDKDDSVVSLENVYVGKDGKTYVAVREKNIKSAELTPAAKAAKKANPKYEPKDSDYVKLKRVNNYGKNGLSRAAMTAILNTQIPEGNGETFGSFEELSNWANNHVGQKKQTNKQESNSDRKYSSVEEKAITTAMKNNPGYTREEIVSALKLK